MVVSPMCPAIPEWPWLAKTKRTAHERTTTGDERTQTLPAKLGQKKKNMTATAVILSLLLSKSDCGRNCDESLNATPQIRWCKEYGCKFRSNRNLASKRRRLTKKTSVSGGANPHGSEPVPYYVDCHFRLPVGRWNRTGFQTQKVPLAQGSSFTYILDPPPVHMPARPRFTVVYTPPSFTPVIQPLDVDLWSQLRSKILNYDQVPVYAKSETDKT